MVAVTLNLDLPESVADFLARLPRAEQNQFALSAFTMALDDVGEAAWDDSSHPNVTALLSQTALANDWERPEEDAAWSHLQSAR